MSRAEKLKKILSNEPAFRILQLQKAVFDPNAKSWKEITTLPKELRKKLDQEVSWQSCRQQKIISDRGNNAHKALLKLEDGNLIESVMLANARKQITLCLSSQVGCGYACAFCATGKMGLKRNLSSDEITDQFRFWQNFLVQKFSSPPRISNLVLMGMGEPLKNYENVKQALNLILKNTDIGPTHITVSTVGVLDGLEKILTDKGWPPVRLAISLHALDYETRKKIVPSTEPDFFPKIINWSKRYLDKFGNRRHYLSFEYIMISGLNDSEKDAVALIKFCKKISQAKINLIPCNPVDRSEFKSSSQKQMEKFQNELKKAGIVAMLRDSAGKQLQAACGQLTTLVSFFALFF